MLVELAYHLLCDEHGLSEAGYNRLMDLIASLNASVLYRNLLENVKATDGRFYLPEDFDKSSLILIGNKW